MAVSSVTVKAPADGVSIPDGITKPAVTYTWAGGTGPWDAEIVWDDDPSFNNGNGNRQIVTEAGVASITDRTVAPPADLADRSDGHQWYLRVTVTDTADAGSAQDADNDFTFFDPKLKNRFLYALANVGVGFSPIDDPAGGWGESIGGTVGPDGDAANFPRFLYAMANVGVGFRTSDEPAGGWGESIGGTWGDGDERDFPRHLYALANVDTSQPCPFLFSVSPTQTTQGGSVTVTGQGLISGETPDTWGAEVRLYDSPGGSYTVMPILSATAGEVDSVTVSVPGAATSGFVAVAHTVGATCEGSNLLALTVLASLPDGEAGWRVEIWNLRNSQALIRPLADVVDVGFEHVPKDQGRGQISVPANHPDLPDICDPRADPPVQTLVKVYVWDRFAYGFLAESVEVGFGDDGARLARVSGPGQEEITRWGRLLWRDYPAQPAAARTWLYGSDENLLPWGSFDDSRNLIDNPGFEDGDEPPWVPYGGGQIVVDIGEVRSGAYSLKLNPLVVGGGGEAEFSATEGWRVYVDGWLRDSAGSGSTVTVSAVDPDENVLGSDSVTLAAPWRQVSFQFVVPSGVSQVTLRAVLSAGTPVEFWLDDLSVVGDPGPWEVPYTFNATVLRLSRAQAASGTTSLEMAFGAGGDTMFQGGILRVPVEPNRRYTASARVTGDAGRHVKVSWKIGGAVYAETLELSGAGTWLQTELTGTAGPDEDVGLLLVESADSVAHTAWLDDLSVVAGDPAATAGAIVLDVLDAMQARGTLTFLQTDFSAELDSAGVAWPETLAVELEPQWTLFDLLGKLVGLGYEWTLAPVDWVEGGDAGWELRVAARLGVDFTGQAGAPTVLPGPAVAGADGESAVPSRTVVFAEGAGGVWSVAEDPAWVAALERREDFLVNGAALGSVQVGRLALTRLGQAANEADAFSVEFSDAGDPAPYLDFRPLDTVRAHLPRGGPGADYRAAMLATNPVAYWRLGETSGTTAADSSGHGHDGTYANGPTLGQPGLVVDPDTAVLFDGVNDRVAVPQDPALQITGALTVQAWVKPTALGSNRMIVWNGTTNNAVRHYMLRLNPNGSIAWSCVLDTGAAIIGAPSGTISPGGSYHVAATRDASLFGRIYVNGVQVVEGQFVGAVVVGTPNSMRIGSFGDSADFFNGVIDEVAVHNYALTPAQIAALYARGVQGSIAAEPDEIPDGWYRAVATRFAATPQTMRFDVDFGRYRTGPAATDLLLSRLLDRQASDTWTPGEGTVAG